MDKMTAVSLVEYNTPTSLRSCGSSVGSFVQNRRRLKCYSPDKKVSGLRSGRPHLSGKPDVRGRLSVPPRRPSLDGALVASPLQSPLEQHPGFPYCQLVTNKWDETKYACPPSASVSSGSCDLSDDFSEEDLDKYVSHDSPENLQVLGSKFKLHGMYDFPRLSGSKTKTPHTPVAILSPDVNDDDERESGPSPENPPPSPVNFLPSVEGFVVGGRKVFSPVKSTGSPIPSYSARDFVPGFVKHPLYHCGKCEDRVVEEEQSLTALNKKMQHYLHSRASHHRRHDEDHTGPAWSQSLSCSQVMCFNPDSFTSCLNSCEAETKTFIEVYQEKKRQKEEKEREWKEKQERIREGKQKEQLLKLKGRFKKSDEDTVRNSSSNISSDHKKGGFRCGYRNGTNSYDQSTEDNGLRDLSNTDVSVTENERQILKLPSIDPTRAFNDNLRLRRCWSDIWPFQDESSHKIHSISGENITLKCSDNKHSRGRITPFYSLPHTGDETTVKEEQYSMETPATSPTIHSHIDTPEVLDEQVMSESAINLLVDEIKEAEIDGTMTATVIVPQKDVSCSQWVTFNGDNEPILNNAPAVDDGCDTYLKRLQRSKLYSNSDPALPGNSQFCFKAVVDKRYNRWKRRRRKKKDLEFRRASIPPTSESSDENDDGRNMAMERIIERMYDQINGCPPQTPGGSRDTPRIRNRRRRQEKDLDREIDDNIINYDASSEWTTSDKDGALLSSSSGSCTGNPIRTTPEGHEHSEGLCNWPFLEQYREEIMKRITETTEDKQEDILSQNDWLPDITPPNSEPNRQEIPPESGKSAGSLTPVEQQPLVKVRSNSGASLSPESTPEPISPQYNSGQPPTTSFSYSTWCRLDKPIRNSSDDDSTKIPRTRANIWDEMEASPCTAKHVSVVAVDKNELNSTFKAAIRPIKRTDLIATPAPKPIKKIKENLPHRFQSVNMPSLSKNSKSQTIPALERKYNSKPPKVSKKVEVSKEHMFRPKTQPQITRNLRKTKPTYQTSVDNELLFRDYYLRSLYNRKGRINSHATSFASGSKLKKTITVDNLDLGHRRNSRKKTEEENLSNLSFTRSFTFSMFNLPEMYKVYNNRLEQRANGQEVADRE